MYVVVFWFVFVGWLLLSGNFFMYMGCLALSCLAGTALLTAATAICTPDIRVPDTGFNPV
jgi:uncharacterized membrane protein